MVPSLQGEDLWTFWNQVGLMVIAMVMVMLMVLCDGDNCDDGSIAPYTYSRRL